MIGSNYVKIAFIVLLVFAIMVGFERGVTACTLWAAAGQSIVNGGTIIAKNRDWYPNQTQKIELVKNRHGYQFIGLYAEGETSSGIKAGVNEYGLVVINAAAPSNEFDYEPKTSVIIEKLLSNCKDIPDALRHRRWFYGPRYLLLADRERITSIEIGLNGSFKTSVTDSATLCHTNHYLEPEFSALNPMPIRRTSLSRLNFIERFLASKKEFSIRDFIKVSYSRKNGPNNSLWRRGSSSAAIRTLATWIVAQPVSGEPMLFVRLANPNEEIKEYYFDLEAIFGKKVAARRHFYSVLSDF